MPGKVLEEGECPVFLVPSSSPLVPQPPSRISARRITVEVMFHPAFFHVLLFLSSTPTIG
jgi:hypothetical protein